MTTTTFRLGRDWTRVSDPEDGPVTVSLNVGGGTAAVYYGDTAPLENTTHFVELDWVPPRPDFALPTPTKNVWCRAAGAHDVTQVTVIKG